MAAAPEEFEDPDLKAQLSALPHPAALDLLYRLARADPDLVRTHLPEAVRAAPTWTPAPHTGPLRRAADALRGDDRRRSDGAVGAIGGASSVANSRSPLLPPPSAAATELAAGIAGVAIFIADDETCESCLSAGLFGDTMSSFDERRRCMAATDKPVLAALYRAGSHELLGLWQVTEFGAYLNDAIWPNQHGATRFPVQAAVRRIRWGPMVPNSHVRAVLRISGVRLPKWLPADYPRLPQLLDLWPHESEQAFSDAEPAPRRWIQDAELASWLPRRGERGRTAGRPRGAHAGHREGGERWRPGAAASVEAEGDR